MSYISDTSFKKVFQEEDYSPKLIGYLYGMIFVCNLLINIDHGSIPAATLNLKKDLNIDNVELGVLGSLVYLGLTVGSMVATPIFSYMKAKYILILSFLLNAGSLILFTVSTNLWILSLSRFLVGFCQVFVCIYFPVWVDTFGKPDKKTLMLTLLMLAPPIGVVLGYLITAFMIAYYTWQYAFYIQAVMIGPCLIGFMITPDKYFDIEKAVTNLQEKQTKSPQFTSQAGFDDNIERRLSNKQKYSSQDKENFGLSAELFASRVSRKNSGKIQNFMSQRLLNSSITSPQFRNSIRQSSFGHNQIEQEALSLLYFIITGIQFWISDYLQVALNVDQKTVFIFYSFTCISGPTIGVIVGGVVIHSQGGYQSPNALKTCLIVASLAVAVSLPVPFIDNFQVFAILIWLLLFFGGFIVPIMTGLILILVQPNERTVANSIANLSYNLLGYLPSPFLYGLLQAISGDQTELSIKIMIRNQRVNMIERKH
eukprot:403356061